MWTLTTAPERLLAPLFLGLSLSCDRLRLPEPDQCPADLEGVPSRSDGTMVWGGPADAVAAATVTKVAVECIPEAMPPASGSARSTVYRIATTSTIAVAINDTIRFKRQEALGGLRAKLLLEAMSDKGVVVGSAEASFSPTSGQDIGTASTVIQGLSPEATRRVKIIVARWRYGD